MIIRTGKICILIYFKMDSDIRQNDKENKTEI